MQCAWPLTSTPLPSGTRRTQITRPPANPCRKSCGCRFPVAKVLDMNIPVRSGGVKADDWLGTISRKCESADWDSVVVTGDRILSSYHGKTKGKTNLTAWADHHQGYDPVGL